MIEQKTISEKAGDYFENGFHCAEAVAVAVLEGLGQPAEEAAAHATAFGGGFGRTFEEACGAISGSLIVIGQLYGRRRPKQEWDVPAALAATIRQLFLDHFKTSHCATLRERFGQEMQMKECKNIVRVVAADLVELLLTASKEVQES
ncbi:MAG: C-GCAxxG-C-C family protein [Proteobacteria bacterium]|nr:C-GCAxxG-C-C family protein [Pseudomonadota bacterium]MBU1583457.1 C-GCAxxG-C-C family protein [Pseudomonadota bacterium]MBU2452736.1 C-GCAxxG-C-C family protein [Pseudomonadota bacterium]MBU2631609.1 C-GCAxxG-C-C family protein [Pseudomonadota bacterium]